MTHAPPEQTATGLQPAAAPARTSIDLRLSAARRWARQRRPRRFAARALETHSPVFGRVVDVSDSGLRLASRVPLAAGDRYTFRLAHGSRFLHLPGRVAWSRLDHFEAVGNATRAVFHAGIQLQDTRPASAWRATLAARAGVVSDG